MDASPPTPARDLPAYVAPAPAPAPPTDARPWAEHTPPTTTSVAPSPAELPSGRAPFISGRIGFGLGLGGKGIAGDYFAQVDLWPLSTIGSSGLGLGFGFEAEQAGSTDVGFLQPADTDNFAALRLRLLLRCRVTPSVYLAGAFGIGVASFETNRPIEVDPCAGKPNEQQCDDEDDSFWPTYATSTQTTSERTMSFELGIHGQLRAVEGSLLVRVTVTGPDTLVTVGPALGFGL